VAHATLRDVGVDEMIEGQSLRGKCKQKPNTMNFALMINVQGVYEPQVFKEETRKIKWEKAMEIEHDNLMKNQTCDLKNLPPGKETHRIQMGV
jgi:hypothetical protein